VTKLYSFCFGRDFFARLTCDTSFFTTNPLTDLALRLPNGPGMRLLQWRPRAAVSNSPRAAFIRFPALGDFVGCARYAPKNAARLTPGQRAAIGCVVDLQFAGIVDSGPLAGQSLYAETPGSNLLGGGVIPEQDVEFLEKRED
jgi:hypothetical protein